MNSKKILAIGTLLIMLHIMFAPSSYADSIEKRCVNVYLGYYDEIFLIYEDGSISVHNTENNEMKEVVESWDSILQIHARADSVFGLRKDGQVVWVKLSNEIANGFSSVSSWRDISYITSTEYHVFGLTKNGKIEVAGDYFFGLNEVADFTDWDHIVQIASGCGEVLFEDESLIGVKENGTLIIKGNPSPWVGRMDGIRLVKPVMTYGAVAIKNDGSVIFNRYMWETCPAPVRNIVNSQKWRSIVTIEMFNPGLDDNPSFIGLRSDGTLVTENMNIAELHLWNHLKDIKSNYYYGVFGIQQDGTLLHIPSYVDSEVFENWKGIEKLFVGENIVIGLKNDGTLVYYSDTGERIE